MKEIFPFPIEDCADARRSAGRADEVHVNDVLVGRFASQGFQAMRSIDGFFEFLNAGL